MYRIKFSFQSVRQLFVGSIPYTSIIIMIKITLINIVLKKVYNYPVATFSYLLIPAACVMVDKKCTVL